MLESGYLIVKGRDRLAERAVEKEPARAVNLEEGFIAPLDCQKL